MLRTTIVALAFSVAAAPAFAGPIGLGAGRTPYGPQYSPSSLPFEAFEWTPLDFAAFSAYGGDFANVRRPVMPVVFFEDPVGPPSAPGPDDERLALTLFSTPIFEELPLAMHAQADASRQAGTIPEPGALLLVGLGLLGASTRLRRAYRKR